jgi:predicted permease
MMDKLSQLWRRLLFYARRDQFDRELEEEMRFHLEMKAHENAEAGMESEEARYAAQRQFGNQTLLLEASREMWGVRPIETLFQDLRFGLRMLRKHPGFTLIAALSLALGIGANTAIFSLINTALLKPLPVKDPNRLVFFTFAGPDGVGIRFNFPLIEQFAKDNQSFTDVVTTSITADWRMLEPGAGRETELAQATRVSGNYFAMLGVGAVIGRMITEADDSASGPQPVAVISYNFWKRRFGLDGNVVGKKITLDNYPFTIVGVAPEGFFGFEVGDNPDVWFPLRMTPLLPSGNQILTNRNAWVLRVMARLKPGVSREQAQAEMDAVLRRHLSEVEPARAAGFTPSQRRNYFERSIRLEAGSRGYSPLRKTLTRPLLALMIIVGFVLLIACANVASLSLTRAAVRSKEFAVRSALGAGRLRLMRQLLIESLSLAMLSGALGLPLSYWGARLSLFYLPRQTAAALDIGFDLRVIGFTMAVSFFTALLFGVVPALRATRLDLHSAMTDATSGGANHSRMLLRKSLVVTQVALSLCLLIGAGLFVRSLQNLRNLDAGFDRENVVLFELDTLAKYAAPQRLDLLRQLFAKLEALPGARAASRAQFSLLSGATTTMRIAVDGQDQRPDADMTCHQLWVGPKFFMTMGIPLLRGRDFNAQESQPIQPTSPNASLAAVINQAMAREYFGARDPIGRRFRLQEGAYKNLPIEVVGIAKDTKYANLREQSPRTFYLSFFQAPNDGGGTYMLRTLDATTNAKAIERIAHELDPQLQALNLRTMNDVVEDSLAQERFVARLGGFFGLSALLLACVGLYGALSYATTCRTREIGIRLALGASRNEALKLILKQGMRLVLAGTALGILSALAVSRAMKAMLFGLSAADPTTYVAAPLLLMLVALLACYLPARRATKVDPVIALRRE